MKRPIPSSTTLVIAVALFAGAFWLSSCSDKVVASGPPTTTTPTAIGEPAPPGCAQDSAARLRTAQDKFNALQASYETQLQSAMGSKASLPTDQASVRGIFAVMSSVQKSSASAV